MGKMICVFITRINGGDDDIVNHQTRVLWTSCELGLVFSTIARAQ
jgi:hypothetical protein